MNKHVSVESFSFSYDGDRDVIDNISFDVEEGSVFGLVGINGAGKTTLLRSLCGFASSYRGTIRIPEKNKIGYLPEERGVYKDATVKEHLKLFQSLTPEAKNYTTEYWYSELGIGKLEKYRLKELSKGTAQRVQLALALINSPSLLILDEPFSGLDPINRDVFIDIINIVAKSGSSVILSSHEINFIESHCDNFGFLVNGSMSAIGSRMGILEEYSSKFIEILGATREDMDGYNLGHVSWETNGRYLTCLASDINIIDLFSSGIVNSKFDISIKHAGLEDIFRKLNNPQSPIQQQGS